MTPAPLPPYAFTGRKLGVSVLGYVLAVIGVVTLTPFAFVVPSHVDVMLWDADNLLDPALNVVLFLPVGFLFALTRAATAPPDRSSRQRTVRLAALFGLLASTAIELTQLFEPARYPSPADIVTNMAGAWLGALLFVRAARLLGADTPLVGRLALETPLMGLVYVSVPMCMLAAITTGRVGATPASLVEPRAIALVALGAFGGTLLGHVQRHHFGPARALTPKQAMGIAAAWFALAALPAAPRAPLAFGLGVVAAAVASLAYGVGREGVLPLNRRFERAALVRATPWLVVYLVGVAAGRDGQPNGSLAMLAVFSKLNVLGNVCSLASFTVLGYVLAEAWGRLELRYRHTAWRVALVAVGGALVSEALRAGAVPPLASAGSVIAHALAAGYGGWMYHLQRAHVRALVVARAARTRRGGEMPSGVFVRKQRRSRRKEIAM